MEVTPVNTIVNGDASPTPHQTFTLAERANCTLGLDVVSCVEATPVNTIVNGGASPTPHQTSTLAERTNRTLLKIIRDNFGTQYATQAPILSAFRNAVLAHGGTKVDATLLADFLAHVPLSTYDPYEPFVDRFNVKPCKIEEVENLFAPGFPAYFAYSSATSGKKPKMLPKYCASAPRCPFYDSSSKTPLAAVVHCGIKHVKEIEDTSGHVVQRIPVCIVTGGSMRQCFQWKIDDDESRMSLALPYYAVPWAATIITHLPSFLKIHGLFFLTHRDVDRFYVPLATHLVDLIRHIDEQWDTFISCIRDGSLPDLEGIEHVREYLQAQLYADPERAAELLEIGAPFSREGWISRVWPRVNEIVTRCGGQYFTLLPKIRFICGSNVSINCLGYGSTETLIGSTYDVTNYDEFVLDSPDFVEFLDVSKDETRENICQAWEVEVGKHYEPILTTKMGLWRYRLGDIVHVTGFHSERDGPTFKYLGRKGMNIKLPHALIPDLQLLESIKTTSSDDTMVVQEFTTAVDDRTLPPTVGFFVELTGPLGPNAHLAPHQLFDALVATNHEHQRALQDGLIRLPTVHIVKSGTFSEFRFWRAKVWNISSGQVKVPLVLDPAAQEWMMEWVVQEL